MKSRSVYISHAKNINSLRFYSKLEEAFPDVRFIFPHKNKKSVNVESLLMDNKIDFIIAEISLPATGQGIELGWAYWSEVPIYSFYIKGSDPSKWAKKISTSAIEYINSEDFENKIRNILMENGIEN